MTTPRSNDKESMAASRRTFLKTSSAAVVGGVMASPFVRSAHAAGDDVLKVGLIGCGGRGTGAARNAMQADPNVQLTAMGDVFADRLENSRGLLTKSLGDKYAVTDETAFSGWDAYKKVIDSGVDVVILATPPHFRPAQLKYAVDADKHIFCEKPVAVDGPGCRSVFETVAKAREKKLNLVSGLCWRYDKRVRATVQRILDGAIGRIVAIQENYLTGTLWQRPRQDGWTDMEYQMRNWLYYTWLSGDHNTEQHVHSLDKAVWLNGDIPPVSCVGLGGREVRTEPQFGNIFDHHAVCYDFPEMKVFAYTRQMRGCSNDVDDYVLGANGSARILKNTIETLDPATTWKYDGERGKSMYDAEHDALFGAIRSGNTINNGEYMTISTLMAIMGRMATYTGKTISYEDALNSEEDLTPDAYAWGPAPEVKIAVPGVTPFK
jgi:predicted dehydrogenase